MCSSSCVASNLYIYFIKIGSFSLLPNDRATANKDKNVSDEEDTGDVFAPAPPRNRVRAPSPITGTQPRAHTPSSGARTPTPVSDNLNTSEDTTMFQRSTPLDYRPTVTVPRATKKRRTSTNKYDTDDESAHQQATLAESVIILGNSIQAGIHTLNILDIVLFFLHNIGIRNIV